MFKSNKELLKAIDPKLAPSYSPNLHKWLKAWVEKYPPEHLPEVWKSYNDDLWIGKMHTLEETSKFTGLRMIRVMLAGVEANKYSGTYTGRSDNTTQLVDFWEKYLEVGCCAYDTSHELYFLNTEDRYTYNSETDTHKCNWCGAEQKHRVKNQTKTIELVSYC